MNDKYLQIIKTLRKCYEDAGFKLLYPLEHLGDELNPYFKSTEGIQLIFDNDVLFEMKTLEGSHNVLGSTVCGDCQKALDLIKKQYPLEQIRGVEYQHYAHMGPVYKIIEA